jgi:hypothetical protein
MNDIEDFPVDIDESGSNEKGAGSIELLPLLLLQQLDLFLRGYLLLQIVRILFNLLRHLAAHLLQFYLNLGPLLLYQLLQLLKVVRLLPESNALARLTVDLIKLESQLDVDADRPQVVNHYLLHVDVLESVGIRSQLSLILDSFLIRLKGLSPSPIRTLGNIVNPFG